MAADARFVIEVVLKARDDMAQALEGARKQFKIIDDALAGSERQARERSERISQSYNDIAVSAEKSAARAEKAGVGTKIAKGEDEVRKMSLRLQEMNAELERVRGTSAKSISAYERLVESIRKASTETDRLKEANKRLHAAILETSGASKRQDLRAEIAKNKTAIDEAERSTRFWQKSLEKISTKPTVQEFIHLTGQVDTTHKRIREVNLELSQWKQNMRTYLNPSLIEEAAMKVEALARALVKTNADAKSSARDRTAAEDRLVAAEQKLVFLKSENGNFEDKNSQRFARNIRMQQQGVAQERAIYDIRQRLLKLAGDEGKGAFDPERVAHYRREVGELYTVLRRLGVSVKEINELSRDTGAIRAREQEIVVADRLAKIEREAAKEARAEAARLQADRRANAELQRHEDEQTAASDAQLRKDRADSEKAGQSQRRSDMASDQKLVNDAIDEAFRKTTARRAEEVRQKKADQAEADAMATQAMAKARKEAMDRLAWEKDRQTRLNQGLADYERRVVALARTTEKLRSASPDLDPAHKAVLETKIVGERKALLEVEGRIKAINPKVTINADLDVGKVTAELLAFKAAAAATKIEVGGNDGGGGLIGYMRGIKDSFQNSSGSVSSFDNFLRGLMTLGIAVFFNQLVVLATAAAGALAALASSALLAASALGGLAAAGIGQLLPVVGVMVAAFMRVAAVIKTVQQAQLLQQQQAAQGQKINKRTADSEDAIRSAQERVADSYRRVTDAQRKLTEAREAARRDLEDLILTERDAELAARGASLSQEEAQKRLREAVASGKGDLEELRLRAEETQVTGFRSERGLARAQPEAAKARELGVEGSDKVRQATEALRDAERAAADAERGLARAKRGADVAGADALAAAGKLNFLLSQLSPAEIKLYKALNGLITQFRKVSQQVTEPIIGAFAHVVAGVSDLLKDPKLIGGFSKLADAVGASISRIFDAFTKGDNLKLFERLISEATRNIKPLTDIAINFGQIFFNIADAAAPIFRKFLDNVVRLTDNFVELTSHKGSVQSFFAVAADNLNAWLKLAGAVANLFIAIAAPGQAGGGADAGLKMVNGMTAAVDGLTKKINENPEGLAKFFKLTRDTIAALAPVLKSIAHEIALTFTEQGVKNVKALAAFVGEVLIPAFGKFIRLVGSLAQVLGALSQNPITGFIMRIGLEMTLFFGIAGKLLTIFKPLGAALNGLSPLFFGTGEEAATFGSKFRGAMTGALLRLRALWIAALIQFPAISAAGMRAGVALRAAGAIAMGPWGIAIAAIVAGIVLLDHKFHFLGPTLKWLKGAFNDVLDWLKTHWPLVLTILTGPFGLAVTVIAKNWSAISGAISGAFDTIKRIITGGAKWITDKLGDLADAVLSILPNPFRKAGKGAADGLVSGIKSVGNFFLHIGDWLFDHIIKPIYDFFEIKSPSGLFMRIGKSLVDGFINGFISLPGRLLHWVETGAGKIVSVGKKIVDLIIDGVKGAPNAIKDAIEGLIKKIPGGKLFLKGLGVVGDVAGAVGGAAKKLNPLNWATGGPVPGSGNRDTIPAMLTPGEHVWTKGEVAAAGGHSVMYALRAFLGGGRQGGPRGYAEGGQPWKTWGPTGEYTGPNTGQASSDTDTDTEGQARRWRMMWDGITATTRRGAQSVETRIRSMRMNITDTISKLREDFAKDWQGIEDSAKRHATDLYKGVQKSFESLQDVAYQGLRYVGGATNSALKDLGGDSVKLSIRAPVSRAATGWIGNQGERGKDSVWALLGRGEAVLNWAQQKVVEPALNAFYGMGLGDVMSRTKGFHAGGQESPGFAGGFAGHIPGDGESVPIAGQPGEFIAQRIATQVGGMMRRFHMAVTDGFALTGHAPGSDHYKGLAADFVPGTGGSWDSVDRAATYAKSKLGSVFRWIGYDGVPGHGRGNHLHLSWLADPGKLGAAAMDNLKRIAVQGHGALKDLAQKAVDLARKAGNTLLGGASDDGFLEAHATVHGGLSSGQTSAVINKAMALAGVPSDLRGQWRTMALARAWQESAFNPNSVNRWDDNARRGTPSQGLFQTIGPTFAAYSMLGHQNILNPLDNSVAAFRYMLSRYGQGDWNVALRRMLGQAGQGYATGGIIPGDFSGQPTPILGHAGEWVVNKIQQSKLASWAGTSRDRLRSALGFTGGPTEFQGGGEVRDVGVFSRFGPQAVAEREHEDRKNRLIAQMRTAEIEHDKKRIASINEAIKAEDRLFARRKAGLDDAQKTFDQMVAHFRGASSSRQAQAIAGRQGLYASPDVAPTDVSGIQIQIGRLFAAVKNIRIRKVPAAIDRFVYDMDKLTGDDGLLSKLAEAIDANAQRMATRLALARAGLRRIKSLATGRDVLQRQTPLDDAGAAAQEVRDLEVTYRQLRDQRNRDADALKATEQQLKKVTRGSTRWNSLWADRNRLIKDLDDGDAKIATNVADQYQKAADAFNAQTTKELRETNRASTVISSILRAAQTLGRTDLVESFGQAQVTNLRNTQTIILNRLRAAQAAAANNPKMQAVADDLEKQYLDLSNQIIEQTAANLTNAISTMEANFSRQAKTLDIVGRAADLSERRGNKLSAASTREEVGGARLSLLQQQLAKTTELMQRAGEESNWGVYKDLADKVVDLRQSIEEQTQTNKDLVHQYRQTATAIITTREQRGTGLIGSGLGIFQKLDQIMGSTNMNRILDAYQRVGEALTAEVPNIVRNAMDAIGGDFVGNPAVQGVLGQLVSAFQEGPSSLANALVSLGPQIASIEANLGPEALNSFQAIVASLLDNTTALLDNTDSIKQLTVVSDEQSFSSTAWDMFRTAVFTGSGGILPQYDVPHLASGGYIAKGGLAYLHAAEVVRPSGGSSWGNGDTNVNVEITEADHGADYVGVGNAIAFKLKEARVN